MVAEVAEAPALTVLFKQLQLELAVADRVVTHLELLPTNQAEMERLTQVEAVEAVQQQVLVLNFKAGKVDRVSF
jgi:hypothetical protein